MASRTAEHPEPPPERIIRAARKLFLEHGFAHVSTDMLAKEAKLSKATLYKHYDNLSAVLAAVIVGEAPRFEAGVPEAFETWDEFREAIIHYGANLLRFLNDPEIIRMAQLIHEEARLHPGISEPFFKNAYFRTHRNLTAMIGAAVDAGWIDCVGTPSETAEQLLGMWEPLRWTKAVLGLSRKPYPRPEDWSRKCVDALLRPL